MALPTPTPQHQLLDHILPALFLHLPGGHLTPYKVARLAEPTKN